MLAVASPIALASPSSFPRSSKDTDGTQQLPRGAGLDAILKDTVEFVEGSSTGGLAQAEVKYPYINVSNDEESFISRPSSPSKPPAHTNAQNPLHLSRDSLYDRPMITSWLIPRETSAGFVNTGNTCFLNSVLQCLIHTPSLQHLLDQHGTSVDKCRVSDTFCMACKLKDTMEAAFIKKGRPFIPAQMVGNLHRIAKHMRRGRQEDAHEFLRYSVDALQRSCLAGHPPKLDPKIAETTWVHRLFGGRLRSRVTCNSCGHPSDTFDAILDLSLDIQGVSSLRQAMAKFVQVDHLRGANKYKCERCQKPVNAEKQLTVHDAPVCLTVHLKRFTPLGRKIGHIVEYGHSLELQPAMSEGQHGPRYTLYGVISHAGSGPNSGHYYAHVRGPDGHWYEANDETVIRSTSSTVIGRKNAYMLFYMRQQGDALGAAIGLHGGGGVRKYAKRKTPEGDDEDRGVATDGTAALSPMHKRQKSESIGSRLQSPQPYPQAVKLQEKIAKAKAEAAKSMSAGISLVTYSSGEEELPEPPPPMSSPVPPPPSSPSATAGIGSSSPIPSTQFYGNPQPKKRKSTDVKDDRMDLVENGTGDGKRQRSGSPLESQRRDRQQAPPKRMLSTPFTSSNMSNNLHASREGLSLSQVNGLNPPYQGRKQQIVGVGGVGMYRPKGTGLASKMKTRSLM